MNPPPLIKEPSKRYLRDVLIYCCDIEMQKPSEKIDVGFVEKCVDLLLQIQGLDATLTDEEIAERVKQIHLQKYR